MEKILLQVISGAAAGYITNDIAIQMLFKKYFGKFGGVIVNTRDSFEENVSELVESEVINHETLKEEINSPGFRKELLNVISDLYNINLKNKCEDKYFGQIKNYDESKDKIIENFNNDSKLLFDKIIKSGVSNICVDNLISDDGKDVIANNLYNLAYGVLKDNNYTYKFYNNLIEEHNEKKLEDLLTPKVFNLFENKILKGIEGLGEDILNNYSDKLDTTYNNVYDVLGLDVFIDEFIENFEEKSLLDVIGRNNSLILVREIKERFIRFIKSSEGKKILNNLSLMVIEILKEQNTTLEEVLDTSMKPKINNFFMERLPEIISQIVSWLRRNQGNFELAIEQSVDEVISECGVIKEKILRFIRNTFINDIARRYEIVDKGINYLEKYKDDRELGEKLSRKILQIFRKKTIGEIISYLEANKIISSNGIQEFLKFNVEAVIDKLSDESLLKLFDIKINKIVPKDLDIKSLIRKKIKNEINLIIRKNFENGIFEKKLKETIKNELLLFKNKKLKDVIGKNKNETIELIGKYSLSKIKDSEFKLIKKIKSEINENLGQKELDDILPDEVFNLASKKSKKLVLEKIETGLENLKGTLINDFVKELSESEGANDRTGDIFLKIINNKLEEMLKGNISKVVASNIHKLDNNELNNMVKDFMGRELKAINIAGAGLGGVVGLAAGNLSGNIGLNIVLYSAIGLITNSMAIGMLFRPYKPFIGIQGVVPKNKPRFAKNMAKFIDERLLNEKVAAEIFCNKKEEILKVLKKDISENNFKLIEKLFLENSNSIFEFSYELIKNKIITSRNEISREIGYSIGEMRLDILSSSDLKDKLSKLKIKLIEELDEVLFNEIIIKLRSHNSLEKIIPKEIKNNLNNMLEEKIEEIIKNKGIDNLQNTKVLNFIYNNLNGKNEIFHKKLVDIIGKDTALGKDIGEYLGNVLKSENFKTNITKSIKKGFSKEFDKNKNMNELFNGKLVDIIYNNKERFVDDFYNKISDCFRNERYNLTNVAINGVRSELGFFEKGAYNLMGGDSLISRVISKFLDDKIPYLIGDSKNTISRITERMINDFSNSRVDKFSIELKSSSVSTIVEYVSNSIILKERMQDISDIIIRNFLDKTPEDYLRIIKIKNLVDLFKLFEKDIICVLENIKIASDEKVEKFSKIIGRLLESFIDEKIYPLEVGELTKEIKDDEIREIMNKIYYHVFYSNTFENIGKDYSKSLLDEIKNIDVSELVDISDFEQNIEDLLNNDQWHKNLKETLKEKCKSEFENNLLGMFNSIENSTKEETLEIIVTSFIDSLADNFQEVLNSLNIAEITEKEINLMSNAKLREVFLRIVGTYFRKLKIYGINGFLFGINNLFSIFLVFTYLFQLSKDKRKI